MPSVNPPAPVGQPPMLPSTAEDIEDVEVIRERVVQGLISCCSNDAAMDQLWGQLDMSSEEERTDLPSSLHQDPSISEIRSKIKVSLMSAAQNGQFDQFMCDCQDATVEEGSMSDIKEKIKTRLIEANEKG